MCTNVPTSEACRTGGGAPCARLRARSFLFKIGIATLILVLSSGGVWGQGTMRDQAKPGAKVLDPNRGDLIWLELSVAEFGKAIERYKSMVKPKECGDACPAAEAKSTDNGRFTPEETASWKESLERAKEVGRSLVETRREAKGTCEESLPEARSRRKGLERRISMMESQKPDEKERAEYERRLSLAKNEVNNIRAEVESLEKNCGIKRDSIQDLEKKLSDALYTVQDQITLADYIIMSGARDDIAWLLKIDESLGRDLPTLLTDTIKVGSFVESERLIRMGADLYQQPGKYSALALADIFGDVKLAAMLKSNGAWEETPWDPAHTPRAETVGRVLKAQIERIERFSASITAPHASTHDIIKRYRCMLTCWGMY